MATAASSEPVRRRYSAKVEKGENAWRREWSGFMSGVSLRDLRKGGGVALPRTGDLSTAANEGSGTPRPFSYLFVSAADKRAARLAKQQEERQKQNKRHTSEQQARDPLAHLSKHERALLEARERGLRVEGMTRKEVRQFLHLTVSKEQREAEQHRGDLRPHELMDAKLQWYQQGPHPIDLIAEKLVIRKALKKGKRLGLRYNYLLPHPSWIAKREWRRRERILVGLGRRFTFDDDGNILDMFGRRLDHVAPTPQFVVGDGASNTTNNEEPPDAGARLEPHTSAPLPPPAPMGYSESLFVDPKLMCRSFIRQVVKDRGTAAAIQNANLTTTYLSSSLVMGPSIGLEDIAGDDSGGTEQHQGDVTGTTLKRHKEAKAHGRGRVVPQKRSRVPSFEP
ncbi:hypothetical protein ERJ75_000997900 [Trypanosoma vivax]|uniref:Uncharacterized protein n=1 Tax=Trypanosoma vivax (strain Y486) TaxID=1055687 RepID=G0UAU5_TRYVY|nr:hypothetical protein TRVL_00727 [Trypanosoma vivax]KAH8611399.1 hypothetical protein ERJ75_000997900 [Trypanosoma vivax]CCC52932.1 conserved hypothetical protein [Trypanosoma vivax Y486]